MATSKDVAKRAGVSHATASRAFTNPELLSAQTLQRILTAAEELNYVPNSLASSLKSSQSNTVGFIISNIRNNFFTDIAYRLQKQLYSLDMNFMIGLSDENAAEELNCMMAQISHRASVILFTPSAHSEATEEKIRRTQNVRFIQLFRDCYPQVSSVTVNDRKGTFLATQLLLERGHEKILLLDGQSQLPTHRDEGYADAFRARGAEVDGAYVRTLPLTGDVKEEIDGLIARLNPTAIIAVSEFLTAQTVEVLRNRSLAIGKDIALIAYDDSMTARSLGITAVGHDEEKIIGEIQELMTQAIKDRVSNIHRVIDPVLIERDSVHDRIP